MEVYDELRCARANAVMEESRMAGFIYEGYGPSGSSIEARRKDLHEILYPVWHHDFEADVSKAKEMLKARGVFSSP